MNFFSICLLFFSLVFNLEAKDTQLPLNLVSFSYGLVVSTGDQSDNHKLYSLSYARRLNSEDTNLGIFYFELEYQYFIVDYEDEEMLVDLGATPSNVPEISIVGQTHSLNTNFLRYTKLASHIYFFMGMGMGVSKPESQTFKGKYIDDSPYLIRISPTWEFSTQAKIGASFQFQKKFLISPEIVFKKVFGEHHVNESVSGNNFEYDGYVVGGVKLSASYGF